jgi:hypothetical protein
MALEIKVEVIHKFENPHDGMLKDFMELVLEKISEFKHIFNVKTDLIMATQAEVEAQLNGIADQLDKSKTELTAEIGTLEAEIAAGGGSTPGVDAAIARLKTLAQGLDDLNPDAPVTEPAPPADGTAPAPTV